MGDMIQILHPNMSIFFYSNNMYHNIIFCFK